jgi:hypothetical protein
LDTIQFIAACGERGMAVADKPADNDDPDATRLLPRAEPMAGLPRGTRLRDVEIDGVIGEGGFSVVYAAIDLNLRRRVAVKEYMPGALATRRSDRTVAPRREDDKESFELGRRSFLNEARLLAQFDHPALVKVHQFWEENGTAYMAMPLYEGCTLKRWLQQRKQPPSESELLVLITPLLDALADLHAKKIFHRDIAPDNVLILGDGRPLLLDFGAARQVLADSNAALTAILKPSYAPIEQYADMGHLRQGPWTDVYALCAVLYFLITGSAPTAAVARSIDDKMVPASKAGAGRYSPRLLRAIDSGLAVRPEARPQSIAELRERLGITAQARPATIAGDLDLQIRPLRTRSPSLAMAAGLTLLVAVLTVWWYGPFASGDPAASKKAAEDVSIAPARPTGSAAQLPAASVDARETTAPTAPAAAADPLAPAPLPAGVVDRAAPRAQRPVTRETVAPPRGDKSGTARGTVATMPERCLRILQRMQLGEAPSQDEKRFLQQECK